MNGTLQSNGAKFKGEVLRTDFKPESDMVVMNLKNAYEVPLLKTLNRTMKNDKVSEGTITVTDEFTASEPIEFGTAVMVNVDYEISGNMILLTSENRKVKVEVSAQGGEVRIKDEVVPVKHLRSGKTSYRIGIDFLKPLSQGGITVRYIPMD